MLNYKAKKTPLSILTNLNHILIQCLHYFLSCFTIKCREGQKKVNGYPLPYLTASFGLVDNNAKSKHTQINTTNVKLFDYFFLAQPVHGLTTQLI